jgi:phage portal protein BeeE
VRSRAGLPVELWWAPSWQMCAENADDSGSSFITHYTYKVDGKELALDPRDVVHFRYGLNPNNPRQGMTPLAPVLREIFTDDEAAAFTAAILRNFGVPGVIVSPDSDEEIDDTDARETKKYLKGQFTGSHRGEPLVMTSRTRVAQFGFSPEQLNLKELRRIPEERVTALIGIAAVVVVLGAGLDRSTFTNMGEAREASYEAGLIPMQRILAEDVRFQLLADFVKDPFGLVFGFDLSKVRVLQPDEYRMAQRYDLAVRGGWAQVAEAREAMGWQVTDADRIYLRPANVVEVPAGGGAPRALAPASLNGSATGANGTSADGNGKVSVEGSSAIAREVADELERRALTAGEGGRSR